MSAMNFIKRMNYKPDSQNEEHILNTAEGTIKFTSKDEEYLYQKKSKIFKHDNIERVVREAGDIINDVIHTEIARNSSMS